MFLFSSLPVVRLPFASIVPLSNASYIAAGEQKALLSRLADVLTSSTPQIGVHFEMASFVEETIMEDLLHYVISHVRMTESSN